MPTDEAGINARKAVILEITQRLTQQGVGAAVALTEAQAGTPWRSWQSIELVADRYAAQNPADAMAWVDSLPRDPSNGGISGVGNVVRNWVRQDPAGFERWIAGTDRNSRLFAQAAGDYALMIASQNYDLAMQWYNQIPESHPAVRAYFGPILQRRAPRPPASVAPPSQ